MKRMKLLLILILTLPALLKSTAPTSAQSGLFNMSYLFFGALNTYVGQVDQTKGSLHVVSPNYFDISQDGQLDITWRLQTAFISEMHKRGIKVVPFLANHWNKTVGINGLNNRDKLAQDIAAAIEKYNLDGVNVDIEGLNQNYKDAHTDFIRLLRKYIPAQKEVSVAVAANPNNWQTGWQGFYDYKGLSQYANYLMIMAYDESWDSPDSPIGPVSSLSFFEKSIQYAINQGTPRDKIVAGLPFYGRMWKLDGPTLENRSITGMGVSSTRVEPLVSQYNGKRFYDNKKQSPYVTFTIPKGQSTFIGSAKLTEGNYIIWYENEASIKAKLHLPKQYGIKGTGSWSLYHETPNTWSYYTASLNWGNIAEVIEQYGSGQIGLTTVEDVNVMASVTTPTTNLKTVPKNTAMKVTGNPVTADMIDWFPVLLYDGTAGFISGASIKRFQLTELRGKDRYDTSVQIAQSGWPETSSVVVLGRGDIPVDALTGSVLATKYKAPLLLTNSNSLPASVIAEMERLSPTTIYILGGESAISSTIQATIEQKGFTVKRIGGQNRFDTSINVAKEVGQPQEIILTTGYNSPDPLAVAPFAGMKEIPIFLTKPDRLPDEVRNFIKEQNITKITMIGGTEAISKNIEAELASLGNVTIERISGKDRYETSIAIVKRYKSEFDLSQLYFSSGSSFIDALPGSPLAANNRAPIILLNNTTLPASVESFLQTDLTATPDVGILGGYEVISSKIRTELFKALK